MPTSSSPRKETATGGALRRGWTTGACATAASCAAYQALLTGHFPDPVVIRLPGGAAPAFVLARETLDGEQASAAIVKDAGDDPDVTHGALVVATVRRAPAGTGIRFIAGNGVGTVTRAGLALAVGEPAINLAPRRMIRDNLSEVARRQGAPCDLDVEISIPGGATLAERTMNGRLGIVGGLSILGTTGIVVPYSCAAWIHAIHRGIDVARAAGLDHVAGATGRTSEAAVQQLLGLPEIALIDMGDFAGGLLKYLRRHPLPRLTIAGGFAKIAKLAGGALDLHSKRSQVDPALLARLAAGIGAPDTLVDTLAKADTGAVALSIADAAALPLADTVARAAQRVAADVTGPAIALDVLIFDRGGRRIGRSDG